MRNRWKALARRALALGLVTLIVVGAACSSDDASDGTASGAGATSGGKATVDAAGNVKVVATDNKFDITEISAKAGQPVTVTLENKGAAIHNFVVVGQKGPDGQDFQTPLIPGNQTATLTFTLPAGTYTFNCSVHPVEMVGKLKVE